MINSVLHAYGNDLPNTATVMNNITQYVKEHRYNLSEDKGYITLYNGKEYVVEVFYPMVGFVGGIHLSNDSRSISFESIAELRGFLRGGGNTLY